MLQCDFSVKKMADAIRASTGSSGSHVWTLLSCRAGDMGNELALPALRHSLVIPADTRGEESFAKRRQRQP